MTHVIIIAAGEGKRFGNGNKHFIEIDGERIIERTIRLVHQYMPEATVYVIANSDEYDLSGATLVIPQHTAGYHDADKFMSSRDQWNQDGRTVVLYGDVYFTDQAMKTIAEFEEPKWQLFCRPYPSEITGKPWGECFAQSFHPQHIEAHTHALTQIIELYQNDYLQRCGGWEHYKQMLGLTHVDMAILDTYFPNDEFMTIIDDWTDDFDFPWDLEIFLKRRHPSISVLIPSSGRASLASVLANISPQLLPGDELLVDVNSDGDWGGNARNRMMAKATGNALMFIDDDDDTYVANALEIVRDGFVTAPTKIHLFRYLHSDGDVYWKFPQIALGNVGTPMIIVPNIKDKLGAWTDRYQCDVDFLMETHKLMGDPVWHEEVLMTYNGSTTW